MQRSQVENGLSLRIFMTMWMEGEKRLEGIGSGICDVWFSMGCMDGWMDEQPLGSSAQLEMEMPYRVEKCIGAFLSRQRSPLAFNHSFDFDCDSLFVVHSIAIKRKSSISLLPELSKAWNVKHAVWENFWGKSSDKVLWEKCDNQSMRAYLESIPPRDKPKWRSEEEDYVDCQLRFDLIGFRSVNFCRISCVYCFNSI